VKTRSIRYHGPRPSCSRTACARSRSSDGWGAGAFTEGRGRLDFKATSAPARRGSLPKKLRQKVGEDGFKRRGGRRSPNRFVSFKPAALDLVHGRQFDGTGARYRALKRLRVQEHARRGDARSPAQPRRRTSTSVSGPTPPTVKAERGRLRAGTRRCRRRGRSRLTRASGIRTLRANDRPRAMCWQHGLDRNELIRPKTWGTRHPGGLYPRVLECRAASTRRTFLRLPREGSARGGWGIRRGSTAGDPTRFRRFLDGRGHRQLPAGNRHPHPHPRRWSVAAVLDPHGAEHKIKGVIHGSRAAPDAARA